MLVGKEVGAPFCCEPPLSKVLDLWKPKEAAVRGWAETVPVAPVAALPCIQMICPLECPCPS